MRRPDPDLVRRAVSEAETVILTTIEEGASSRLVTRPMSLLPEVFEGRLRLIAPRASRCVRNLAEHSAASVAILTSTQTLTITGSAGVVTDTELLTALWRPALDRWIRDGPHHAAMIVVTALEVRHWAPSGGREAHDPASQEP